MMKVFFLRLFRLSYLGLFFLSGMSPFLFSQEPIFLGVDTFFQEGKEDFLKGKRVGLVLNQTSYNRLLQETYLLFKQKAQNFKIAALFCPEHGIKGLEYAAEIVHDDKTHDGIPIYSLHGRVRRPTEAMLKSIDVLIFDLQEIGCRSYTYATTLYYLMEEAAKRNIDVIVLDRPNPINGEIVEGPMLDTKWRSFVGYINIPYCHGMTIGELALFFNKEYGIGCRLQVIPMKGWKRWMNFKNTGLSWIPTSPNIPEADTPYFYVTTGVLGELGIVNIGIGFTQPFKLVGAPWIKAEVFAHHLNEQKLPGVKFIPYYYRPFFGLYKQEACQGVKIVITNYQTYRPVKVQSILLGVLKTLYPSQFSDGLKALSSERRNMFCKITGGEEIWNMLFSEKYVAWKLIKLQEEERQAFLETRQRYLLY